MSPIKLAVYAIFLLVAVIGVWLSITWDDYFKKPGETEETQEQAPGSAVGAAGSRDDAAGGGGGGFGGTGGTSFDQPGPDGFMDRGKDGLPVGNYESNEVLVSNPPESFENAVKSMGFTIIEKMTLEALGMEVLRLRVPQGHTVRTAVKLLRERFAGVNIDANHQFDPSADEPQAAPAEQKEPMLSYARAYAGWGNAPLTCGRDLRIGMIDGVVQTKHPALRGQKIEFRSYHQGQRRAGPADHGTAIAAMFVGRPSEQGWGGIVPGARLLAANMFEYNAEGRLVGSASALLKSLDWLIENKVHVINMSLAGEDNAILRSVVDTIRQQGIIMVAAGGNWGRADRPAFPAAYPSVIAVTAFGERQAIYEMANRGAYIDFAAPGVKMWTAVPGGGRYQSGTSFATPYIATLTAELVLKRKITNAGAIKEELKKYAIDLGVAGKDATYGYGFVARAPGCK